MRLFGLDPAGPQDPADLLPAVAGTPGDLGLRRTGVPGVHDARGQRLPGGGTGVPGSPHLGLGGTLDGRYRGLSAPVRLRQIVKRGHVARSYAAALTCHYVGILRGPHPMPTWWVADVAPRAYRP